MVVTTPSAQPISRLLQVWFGVPTKNCPSGKTMKNPPHAAHQTALPKVR